MLACRARALMDGRYAPSIDDVVALAPPVLRHRMAVSFAGRAEGITSHSGDRGNGGAAAVISERAIAAVGARRPAAAPLRARAEQTAAALPPLLVAAERVAATVAQGVHGRRRVGQGETFWQFREYEPGEDAGRIDWLQSAKSNAALCPRNRMGSGAERVAVARCRRRRWITVRPGISPARDWPTKRDRAELILVALASLLVRGGERLTLLGSGVGPMTGRAALTRLVEMIEHRPGQATTIPDCRSSSRCRGPGSSC